MELNWSPEHESFRHELRTFLEQQKDRAPRGQSGARPSAERQQWQRLLLEKGYTCRAIPQAYGGSGAEPDPLISRILAEEFADSGAVGGLSSQGVSMLVPTLLAYGTEEQKQQYVLPTIQGEMVWCQGYSEPGAGSDLANLRTKATLDGDEWVVEGQKIWTSTANVSDMMFCLVRTEPDAVRHAGISYLLIPMDSPGLEVRPLYTMTGHAEFNEVFFTDVRVPAGNLVGERGNGWAVANNTLRHERGMLGNPDETLVRYNLLLKLMQRETIDGVRAIDNPVLCDRLMQLQGRLLAMRCNSLRLLSGSPAPDRSDKLARLTVKLNGCELNHQIAALAIDALEEVGVLYSYAPMGKQDKADGHLRDNGQWQWQYMFQLGLIIGGGTAQIQKNIISERGLDMPREPRGDMQRKSGGGQS